MMDNTEVLRGYIDARCTTGNSDMLLKLADQLADAVARER
jgi:malic enzyme